MAPRLRVLSGSAVVKILKKFNFVVLSQSGSHVKLRRESMGLRQTLVIPSHGNLAKGTLKAIFNQATKYISQNELMHHFYTR